MTQVARKEGHLLDADDQYPPRGRDRRDRRLDLLAGERAGGLLDVGVVRSQRGLELRVIEVEQGRGATPTVAFACLLGDLVAVLLDRRLLKLGVAVEAEGLREADDGRRGGVGAARQLLRGLEGGLVEVVDDVAGDV